jgi:hypothetical protein
VPADDTRHSHGFEFPHSERGKARGVSVGGRACLTSSRRGGRSREGVAVRCTSEVCFDIEGFGHSRDEGQAA